MNIYEYNFIDVQGKERSLKEFQGKVLLIVNTASKCGFTYQYSGLNELHKELSEKGLVIIGFPCNQFAGQEPGNESEIQNFCKLNYDVNFLLTSKVDVNGNNAHPLFVYLKKELPGLMGSTTVKWNFTKFLVDKNGNPYKRYAPTVEPKDLYGDIKKIL